MPRDLDTEFQDNEERQYAYETDYIVHGYMLESFKPFFQSGPVLEMGCYEGAFTQRLLEVFDDLSILEGSGSLIKLLKSKLGDSVTYHHGMFETATLPLKYKNIFLIHSLEHVDDPAIVLRNVEDWLAPGGRLFLCVPNANAASRQIAVSMGLIAHNQAVSPGEAAHGHRCTYSMDTLKRDLNHSCNLRIVSEGGVLFKALANFQVDKAIQAEIIDTAYLDGCYELGKKYPDLCASIYLICEKPRS